MDDNWPAVVRNFSKAMAVWKRMMIILSWEGANMQVSAFFFKILVQAVLLFGAETWVVTPCMGRVLGGFHDQVARCFTGRLPRQKPYRKWDYTSAVTAMA